MHYWIHTILLLFVSIQAFSEEITSLPCSAPDQIAALTQETSKVGGLVSPLSGQPYLKQTDLIAKGAQDVILSRIFIPQHRNWHANQAQLFSKGMVQHPPVVESGWVIFPHIHLDHRAITRKKYHKKLVIKNEVRITDKHGVALTFALDSNGHAQLVDKPYGICNSNPVDEMPSAQYDFRNTKIVKNDTGIFVHSPQGSIYHYANRNENIFVDGNTHVTTQEAHYLLAKEVLPNGKILRYHYNKERQLVRVISMDPKEIHTYATIEIQSSPDYTTSKFSTNSGQKASYQQLLKKKPFKQPKGSKPLQIEKRVLNLLSIKSTSTPFYASEIMSFDNALLNSYFGQQNLFSCEYAESGERHSKNKRVSKLLLPVDGAHFQPVHEFSYQPPLVGEKAGSTTVRNIDGSTVIYEYSKELLLTAIKHYSSDSTLKRKKQFNWTENHWLSSIDSQDGNGYVLYTKTYEYDAYGNPVREVFSGDLSGKGICQNVTTRQFSNDGRHLLLEEKTPEEKILSFHYLPNTNLMTAKFTKENDRILQREFNIYDDCNHLIKHIEDNGTALEQENLSGVTQRKITAYILRNQHPFLHLPEWIEEKYLEHGSEKVLNRTHLSYDVHGNVCEESVYDAEGTFAYIVHKSYNDRGDLTAVTNAIGQEARYEYDAKGRCISSVNFSKNIQTNREYDLRDRVIKTEEAGIDSICHSTSFSYDFNDHLIKKIDTFKNSTDYSYDPLSHKVTRTTSPRICDKEGNSIPVTTTSIYDVFGREISKTDANGNTTIFHYAGHALPIEIIHPDQSREILSYTQTGLLESHIDQDELKTSYTYDILGRVVAKHYSTPDEEVASETFVYDSFNLLKKTDREGNCTNYTYDGAGRLVSEEISGNLTTYSYDTLGRISTIINHNEGNSLYTHYTRDLLDQVLEKTCTDVLGNVLFKIAYSYDADGNVASITRNINGDDATERFGYDSFQRRIEAIDAEGNKTKTTYDENAVNALGQRVLQITAVDAKNKAVVKMEDPYGRIVQKEIISPDNVVIAIEKTTYDSKGNLSHQKNLIFHHAEYLRTLETAYSYTSCDKLNRLIRAANSPNSRTTLYTYTPGGKIATKTKPDGTVITYGYHPLGYLKTVNSSDNLLRLTYECNRLGVLLKATDEIKNIFIQRDVDFNGNILREKLSTGLAIEKTYDAFDRPLSVALSDQGQILYTYDPLFLRAVSRTSPSGTNLYTHKYTSYDSTGYLQEESLVGALGTIKHTVDPKGRKTAIISPYMTQNCQYDAVDNVIAMTTNGNEVRYAYDELDQLISEADDSYQYDTNHNRIEENGVAWISNELDELLSTGATHCTYDLNGNLLSKKTRSKMLSFTYDPLDRLTQVIKNDSTVEMFYDPLGRRLRKIVHATAHSAKNIENYLYDGENEIGAFSPEGTPIQLRVLGQASKNVPATVAIELGKEVFAPIQDFHRDTRFLISLTSGKQTAEYDFNAFGKQKHISEVTFNPWRYASKRLDLETNLINFGKRYYDAELSRWLTTDPAGFVDGMNLYSYVKNNPIRYVDPDGRFAFAIPLIYIGFDLAVTFITTETLIATFVGAALGWGVYHLDKTLDNEPDDLSFYNEAIAEPVETGRRRSGHKSPHNGEQLGDDPSKCPGEGFIWKGRGPPGSGRGAWHNKATGVRLYPDLDHPAPKGPHWDYLDDAGNEERHFLDGTWEPK
ncbi:MAG: hypothetical protein CK425_08490 [Parachlamydia sp.]|nr:MAG: hypothetical protein CK425_08490 [Parachlamydia sp.]